MAEKKNRKKRKQQGASDVAGESSRHRHGPRTEKATTAATGNRRRIISFTAVVVLCVALGFFALVMFSNREIDVPPQHIATELPSDHGKIEVPTHRLPIDKQRAWKKLDDPSRDGWQTEVVAQEVGSQLKELASLLASSGPIRKEKLASLVGSEFASGDLRPMSLKTVFSDGTIEVQRSEPNTDASFRTKDHARFRGQTGLADALSNIREPFHGSLRAKLKMFHIRQNDSAITTQQHVSLAGRSRAGQIEEHAVWTMHWQSSLPDEKPRLTRIDVSDFQRATIAGDAPLLVDCTASVLETNESYRQQLLYGFNYWLERIQEKGSYSLMSTPGLAVGDVNGDGLDDLYVCQEGGLPNLLFAQNPDATAQDISESSGVNWLESTRGALLVDLDNDGDQDLAATVAAGLVVAENDGRGHYWVRAVLPTTRSTYSLAAADYDQDGDVDLFVCGYFPSQVTDSTELVAGSDDADQFVYHDSNMGAPNSMYRNDGAQAEWKFADVTNEVGLDENNSRFSFAAQWEDFDNDGDQDLYVANDYGRNNLYRNDDGHFVDIAGTAHVEDSAAGMGVTWADFDHDGWMDVYVSNMYSAAGNRIAAQSTFKPNSDQQVRTRLLRFARGNSLFKNLGDGTFSDVSEAAGVTMGRWAWSSNFVDLNNDSWDDLVVANGYVTTEDSGDL